MNALASVRLSGSVTPRRSATASSFRTARRDRPPHCSAGSRFAVPRRRCRTESQARHTRRIKARGRAHAVADPVTGRMAPVDTLPEPNFAAKPAIDSRSSEREAPICMIENRLVGVSRLSGKHRGLPASEGDLRFMAVEELRRAAGTQEMRQVQFGAARSDRRSQRLRAYALFSLVNAAAISAATVGSSFSAMIWRRSGQASATEA